jgi:tRNA G46 methylase TrmB
MMWDGLERFTSTWFENLLLQQWIPSMPDVKAHLERGCDVADVGCGRGHALIKLAQAFPRSRYVGYDNFGRLLYARLRMHAKWAYQTACVSRNAMSRKGCRRSLM